MQNSKAKIRMKKMLLAGGCFKDEVYNCEVLKYDTQEERIYLVLKDSDIEEISLDGIYQCIIYQGEHGLECEGRILERFRNHKGNILHFQVEKGFYKININCVDKKET